MITILAIIALVIFVFSLSSRVNSLEQRIKKLETVPEKPRESKPVVVYAADDEKPVAMSAQEPHVTLPATTHHSPALKDLGAASVSEPKPTAGEEFSHWLKEDWLLKLGALLLLLGFAWLTSYAFMNNWIGPVGRIVLGIMAGAVGMLFGWFRMNKHAKQGSVFLVLGSSIVIVTIFAARTAYDFFTPISALGIMLLCAAFVALASVRYRMQPLAFVSLIIASVVPFLVEFAVYDYVTLFIYLFIVILGSVWIVALTGWRSLLLAGLVIFALYSMPHLGGFGQDTNSLLGISYAFAALFFVTGTLGILKSASKERLADMIVAGGNGLLLLAWILIAAPENWQSLIISGWMLVFLIAAFFVFKITRESAPFLIYSGVGVVMLAAATAVELSGATLTIAYTVEVAVLALVLYMLLRNLQLVERVSLLFVVPVALSLQSIMSDKWKIAVFHEDFFVLLILAAALLGVGLFISSRKAESVAKLTLYPVLMSLGAIYIYVLMWLWLHAAFRMDDVGTIISLVLYTIIGIISYFWGKLNNQRRALMHGGVLLAFVVGRLLIVDVWAMAMGGRITTFFLVGALLTATAFFGRKHKEPTPY